MAVATYGSVPYVYAMAMTRTTVYLPDDLKLRVRRAAQQRGVSQARFIRDSLERSAADARPRPRGGFITATAPEPIDWNTNDHLAGFGA